MKYIFPVFYTILLIQSSSLFAADAVLPGQIYDGEHFTIKAPEFGKWFLIESNDNGMSFGRDGKKSNESYVAQLDIFRMAKMSDGKEMVGVVENGWKAQTPEKRYTLLKISFEMHVDREYLCVCSHTLAIDKKARQLSL